ncbi:MAG: hypothetical protein AMS16_06920 [Planctomycetes bacterium DG_58]|nr:MAG: hypothetical protein AMS16_06920 [Planctomycetes bacterium DG_58]
MNQGRRSAAIVCVGGLIVCLAVLGCKPATSKAVAPVIDGDLSDAIWKTCEVPGDWTDVGLSQPVKTKPRVCVTCDDVNLYVAFFNPEKDMKSIVADATERDGEVWTDDSNEVFIDPTGKREDYYQIIVNTKGVIRDAKTQDVDWDSKAAAKVKMMDDGWSVEMAIPLADLGIQGSAKGQTWAFNFCRNRRTTGEAENQAWADTGESFHNPEAFKDLTLK